MERKTMTAEEIRKQFIISNQAFKNFKNLGVLTPVPGTEDDANPLYYADEVAVIREAMTSCNSSMKRLQAIREKAVKEIFNTNIALKVLELSEATKLGALHSIVDAVTLFMEKAVPNLDKTRFPLCSLEWLENKSTEQLIEAIESPLTGYTQQDYCTELYHETDIQDVSSLLHCIEERDALQMENEALKAHIEELEKKIDLLEPQYKENLSDQSFNKELSPKQIQGLQTKADNCNFTSRAYHCLCRAIENGCHDITLSDVVRIDKETLLKFRNVGKNTITEIIEILAEYDLTLGMEFFEINGKYYSK